jgi:hypothetical protein
MPRQNECFHIETMVGEKMLNPWLSLPLGESLVLADDEQIILEYNKRLKDKYREDQEVHLEVFPEPYSGNPQAKIVLLNLNPGYYPRNKEFGNGTADFRRMWRANLAHEPQEYPFYHLNPRLKGSPGEVYYRAKFKAPIKEFGEKRVAEEFFVVEYFPYTTKRGIGSIPRIPSQEYGFYLVREAMQRNAIIIKTRYKWGWQEAIPALRSYPRYYELRSVQNTAISEKNCPDGYPEIRKILI